MSKTKQNYSQVTKHWRHKFPQFSRFIPAKTEIKAFFYRFFFLMLTLGALFLLIINLYSVIIQPSYLKALLKNPNDTETLKTVMRQNYQPELEVFLKQSLQKQAGNNEVNKVESQKQQQFKKITDLEQLLKQYPNYPDGYAYLAVLYFKQSYCDKANLALERAITLDRNRPIFQELKNKISRCVF